MQNAHDKITVKVLQELFARFGLPETIVSDNGTPFPSKEFEKFCKLLSINHLKSAPYHPRSNGLLFAWKIRSVFDELILSKKKKKKERKQ